MAFGISLAPGSAWLRQRTYAQWAATVPGLAAAQPLDNPDGDALANALEYTLGGDPLTPDAHLFPRAKRDAQGRLVCTLDLAPTAVDGTLIVESRASLTTGAWTELARKSGQGAWSPQPGVTVEAAGAARWRIVDPTLPAAQRYVRVRLEL